ncbi:MAG: flagellar basal body P-ring formation protein FlgA [Geobacter sp.]|nr:flagellar basal body P-ring formation protein FlgA [Geobacter sp.]
MKHLLLNILLVLLTMASFCPGQAGAAVNREREVRDVVTAFVNERTAGMGWDVRIRRITISDALKLPEGAIEYEVVASQQWPGWGNTSMAVLARQKDRLLRNIPVRVDVDAMSEMVVATRQIEHGTLISAEDLVVQQREISYNTRGAARRIEEIAGKKSRTTLKANQPVRADQVEKMPLIKSGQLVTIIAENEVMKVSVAGKARSSGAEGDIIMVQSQSSYKEIPARVISATTVQVAF